MLLLIGWEWKIEPCKQHPYPCLIRYTLRLKGAFPTILSSMQGVGQPEYKVDMYDLITLACELRVALVTVAKRTSLPSYVGKHENNGLLSIHSLTKGPLL